MPQTQTADSTTTDKKPPSGLPPLPTSESIAKVPKGAPDAGTETIGSFATRLRKRFPEGMILGGQQFDIHKVPDGKLVNDFVAKFPEYKGKFRRGELQKAGLSAYWDEAKGKLKDAAVGLIEPRSLKEGGGGGAALRGLYETGAGVTRELAGLPQPGESVLSRPQGWDERLTGAFSILMGGDPAAARRNLLGNRGEEAAADMMAVPFAGLLGGELLRGLPGMRSGGEVIGPTRKSTNALMALMGHELPRLGPEELAHRTGELGEVWKQAARESGITDKTIGKVFPARDMFGSQKDYISAVTRGNQSALDVAGKAVEITQRPIDEVVSRFGHKRVPQQIANVSKTLRLAASETVDDGVRTALSRLAEKVDGAKTVADLNKIKRHANKEASRLYGKNTGGQVNAAAQTVYAYKVAADEIRAELYPELQRLSGSDLDLVKFGKREADAIALRDGMEDIYHRLQGEQADKEALSFGQYVFGEGKEHSLYSRHITKRILEKGGIVPGPSGMLNQITRAATGELGEGAVGERVQSGPVKQKALPPIGGTGEGGTRGAGPNTFFFEIPAGLPEEAVSPITVTESLRYEGTRDLPRLDHEPYDPATFEDSEFRGREQDDRSTGSQSYRPLANKARRQAIGSAADATPDRVFSGPATSRQTTWQRIVASEGGEVSRQGGGVLRTASVDVAQATLDRLREYASNHPSEADGLAPKISALQQRIWEYGAYKGAKPPAAVRVLSGKPGVAGRRRGLRRLTTGAAAAGYAQGIKRSDDKVSADRERDNRLRRERGLPPL